MDWLENAMIANPNGWGIMASHRGQLLIRRGMKPGKFRRALEIFTGLDTFIHFRNATHGTVNVDNCHPFAIVDGTFAVMHNGIIPIDCRSDSKRSDTWHYANTILEPLLIQDPEALADESFITLIGQHVGAGNKLAILRADGTSAIVNRAQGSEIDGSWYSNLWSVESPCSTWASYYDLDDLAKLDRSELIELCHSDPGAIADAILDDRRSQSQWRWDDDWKGTDRDYR